MNLPDAQPTVTALESVLTEVRDTLRELSEAAEEQHRALMSNDVEELDRILVIQELLADRLAVAERQRMALMPAHSLREAVIGLEPDAASQTATLLRDIADAILHLRSRTLRNRALLERSATLAGDTVRFLKRLVSQDNGTYDGRGEGPSASNAVVLDRIA